MIYRGIEKQKDKPRPIRERRWAVIWAGRGEAVVDTALEIEYIEKRRRAEAGR